MDRFDIQKLRALPIEVVAQRLGLNVSRHKSLCPFHDDSHPSLHFSVTKNTYKCFVCDAHGGPIDLVMHHLRKSFVEACEWLANENNIILQELQPADKPSAPKRAFNPEKYLRFFDRPFLCESARAFLFGERKLDPRVVSWCRLNSFTDKQGTSWLQIPYYDIDGHLIGVQSRNLDYRKPSANSNQPSLSSHNAVLAGSQYLSNRGEMPQHLPTDNSIHPTSGCKPVPAPRFKFPYGHTCHIYNLPVLKLLRQGEPLFITEGASDCWAMLSSGHKAIAIPSATLLNRKDLQILSTLNSQLSTVLHMYPDQDIPGEKLYLQLTRIATDAGLCLVRHSLPPGCKDYSDYYVRHLLAPSVNC